MADQRNTQSWGRLTRANNAVIDYDAQALDAKPGMRLPFGNGRSYGDSCHNRNGILLDSRPFNAITGFNRHDGILTAQSGVLLSEILQLLDGTGWFLPVVPGTRFITLGGAIANDIHGKNHTHRGTFGRHVRRLTLKRSHRRELTCSPNINHKLFEATVGGLGLTGFIVSAEIQLMEVPSHHVSETKRAFGSLKEYLSMATDVEAGSEYAVAWLDSLASGRKTGRGIMISADHVSSPKPVTYGAPRFSVPVAPKWPVVAGYPLRLFNLAYYHRNAGKKGPASAHPHTFFFPLDAIGNWNRLYGRKGLYQHQSVLPFNTAPDALNALLEASQRAGQGSFLTVLKRFGEKPSPGLMSFPMPGYTLTLDFPNRGSRTIALLDQLDRITLEAGGRINPYKDAHMSPSTFQKCFPRWQEMEHHRDQAITSDFWRRVTRRTIVDPPSMQTSPINQTRQPGIQTNRLKVEGKE